MRAKFNLFVVLLLTSVCFTFTACSDDDDPVNISLENTEINVVQGATETVKITKGNGDYNVSSASESIATATVNNNEITVTGVTAGETTITVTDKENKTATLKVTVTDYAGEIEGTYKGDVYMAGVETPIASDATITFTRIAENKVTLKLDEEIMDLPINVECDSDVKLDDDKYNIEGTAMYLGMFAVNVKGNIDKTGKATIDINIPDMSISVVYEGEKQ